MIGFLLAGCATAPPPAPEIPKFLGATLEEKGGIKKVVLKFQPDVPQYSVSLTADKLRSEVRWSCNIETPFAKTFYFNPHGRNTHRADITIDPVTRAGLMVIEHTLADTYTLSRRANTELVLIPDDPYRHLANNNDSEVRRINLNVKGAPLDKVIRTLATESKKGLILGSGINGTVTVNLDNLSYEQAIDMVLRPTPYRAEHAGNVTIIRSAKEDKTFRAFKLRYIDVNNVLKTVQDMASKDAQVAADGNTNSVFVVDRFEIVKNIEGLINILDQEPRQVEVEAAIVQVDRTNNLDFGIDFRTLLRSGKSNEVTHLVRTNKISPLDSTLPGTKALFFETTHHSITAILGMLSSVGKLDLMARPRVLTVTDQEASIHLGSKLGYKTVVVTQTGTIESIQFLNVGTQLKIKPHITANNDILMQIHPEISDGQIDSRTGIPSAVTTESFARILARNGQTIVIGGLMRERLEKRLDKVPLLGDLPLIGLLFSGVSQSVVKTEVVIVLCPRIMTSQLATNADREGEEHVAGFYGRNSLDAPRGLPLSTE